MNNSEFKKRQRRSRRQRRLKKDAEKFTKICNARAKLLFCLLNRLVTFPLPLQLWFSLTP
ncbi:unnamed protein product, partial [Pocillopora meandrina]